MMSRWSYLLVLGGAVLFALGLLMIFNTTSAEVVDHVESKSLNHALWKQVVYFICGLGLSYAVYKCGVERLVRWSPYLFIGGVVFLVMTLIPGLGKSVNGSRRWLHFFGVSVQPSEAMKLIFPLYFTCRLGAMRGCLLSFRQFLELVGWLFLPIILIVLQPNNGTAGVLGLAGIVLCLLAEIPAKYWALPLCLCLLVGGGVAVSHPYVAARLRVYLHPELDLQGKGHQPYQAKIAAGSGQLWGRGPGNSLQKLSYLPEAQNDYIAAIFAEEFGFFGMGALIFLYVLLSFAAFAIIYQSADAAGLLVGGVIAFLFAFQAFMNLGVVSGLLPSTGLNLPLFSQGGTSLIVNMMGIALLLQIDSRQRNLL